MRWTECLAYVWSVEKTQSFSREIGRDSSVGMGLAKGWTVRGSNPGGARFSVPVHNGPGTDPASCTMRTVFLSRG
jgi:hypothetical protein